MKKLVVYFMVGIMVLTAPAISTRAITDNQGAVPAATYLADNKGVAPATEYLEDISDAVELDADEMAASDINASAFAEETVAGETVNNSIMTVAYHTPEEIRAFIDRSGATLNDPTTYAIAPITSGNYFPGVLSDETSYKALAMLNQVRYIAGISSNVTIDPDYAAAAQAGALVNYVNDSLTHFPSQPAGMSNELYELGYRGCNQANIAWASWIRSVNETTVKAWMADSDNYNIDVVGHRRWLLNPRMGKTGFGIVQGSNGTYSNVMAWDRSNSSGTERGVAWPAQNMPIEYFSSSFPWSISTDRAEDYYAVNVMVTNVATGQAWYFNANGSNGFFNVDNAGYGQRGCIIFRPDGIDIRSGNEFRVDISGLQEGSLSYNVKFFSLNDVTPVPTPTPPVIDPITVPEFGWLHLGGKSYWYEQSIRQGTYWDPKGVLGDGAVRGREIYDPESNAWYWLDSCYDGAKAVGKEVWMPYVFQGETFWDEEAINRAAGMCGSLGQDVKAAILAGRGKWVRYDAQGRMATGWFTVNAGNQHLFPGQLGNTYYYEPITGMMVKGWVVIGGRECYFDPVTGVYDPERIR